MRSAQNIDQRITQNNFQIHTVGQNKNAMHGAGTDQNAICVRERSNQISGKD